MTVAENLCVFLQLTFRPFDVKPGHQTDRQQCRQEQRQDDALCKAFCTPSGSLSKAMFPPFSPSKLLLENACYFPGTTRTA